MWSEGGHLGTIGQGHTPLKETTLSGCHSSNVRGREHQGGQDSPGQPSSYPSAGQHRPDPPSPGRERRLACSTRTWFPLSKQVLPETEALKSGAQARFLPSQGTPLAFRQSPRSGWVSLVYTSATDCLNYRCNAVKCFLQGKMQEGWQ